MTSQRNWPTLPGDVIDFFRSAFEKANNHVTDSLLNVPNIREVSLDDMLIYALIPFSPARRLPSGAVVAMDIHNIGGLRRLGHWETADISVLVFVYRHTQLIARKIGLLQSKRLYPTNNDVDEDEDDPVGFLYGMNTFLKRQPNSPLALLNRQFEFTNECVYGAIKAEADQIGSMAKMNSQLGESLYYLLYNPPSLPMTIVNAGAERQTFPENTLGCRVCLEHKGKTASRRQASANDISSSARRRHSR